MLFMQSNFAFSAENIMSDTHTHVKFHTNLGDFIVELDAEKAPNTVKNFLTYVNEGFYNGTIFHRVIPGFMAQGGGFDEDFKEKDNNENIENEADNGLKNERGTLAMARTNDPHSATSQFFINYKNNSFLNHSAKNSSGWGYAVFAKVIEGMDIVDEMENQKTGSHNGHQDVPKTNIVIETAEAFTK